MRANATTAFLIIAWAVLLSVSNALPLPNSTATIQSTEFTESTELVSITTIEEPSFVPVKHIPYELSGEIEDRYAKYRVGVHLTDTGPITVKFNSDQIQWSICHAVGKSCSGRLKLGLPTKKSEPCNLVMDLTNQWIQDENIDYGYWIGYCTTGYYDSNALFFPDIWKGAISGIFCSIDMPENRTIEIPVEELPTDCDIYLTNGEEITHGASVGMILLYVGISLLIVGIIAFLVYWFVIRRRMKKKKKLREQQAAAKAAAKAAAAAAAAAAANTPTPPEDAEPAEQVPAEAVAAAPEPSQKTPALPESEVPSVAPAAAPVPKAAPATPKSRPQTTEEEQSKEASRHTTGAGGGKTKTKNKTRTKSKTRTKTRQTADSRSNSRKHKKKRGRRSRSTSQQSKTGGVTTAETVATNRTQQSTAAEQSKRDDGTTTTTTSVKEGASQSGPVTPASLRPEEPAPTANSCIRRPMATVAVPTGIMPDDQDDGGTGQTEETRDDAADSTKRTLDEQTE